MIATAFLALVATAALSTSATPLMGGYFANWAQYHTAPYTYTPPNLAGVVGSLDHLMYAFAYVDASSYEVVSIEPKDPQFYSEVSNFCIVLKLHCVRYVCVCL